MQNADLKPAAAVPAQEGGERRTVLKLHDVNKFFETKSGNRFQVLENIDLDVENGTIHALLGRSGCGKTTILNIVAGLLDADSGTVLIDGEPTGSRAPEVGYVFQDDRLMPWRTARGNVAFALENRDLPKREREKKADEILSMMGLGDFAEAFPSELSGGMRSRVALARALVRGPRVLLMDEPFSRLDSETRTTMHEEILRLRNLLGTTVLFVTHDVEEAAVLADYITVLAPHPGRVAQIFDLGADLPAAGRLRDSTDPAVVDVIRTLKRTLARVSSSEKSVATPEEGRATASA